MYNKKRILLISLGTCLLLFITAISFTYYHKNNIKKLDDFTSYLEKYKLELTNYSLIDTQENYDILITKSEQAISNKGYKNITSLKSELDKLKEDILNKNNDIIANFSNYLDSYKNELSTFNLNDNQESYNNLILESEQAISDKNYKNIDSLSYQLNQLKEVIINKNIEVINDKLSELESIDISKISDKGSITSQFEEIKKLRDEKQFIKATELVNKLNSNINSQLESIKQDEYNDEFTPKKAYEYIAKHHNKQLIEFNGAYFLNNEKTLGIGINYKLGTTTEELHIDKEAGLKYYSGMIVDKVAQANGAANGIVERFNIYENGAISYSPNESYNNSLKLGSIAFSN